MTKAATLALTSQLTLGQLPDATFDKFYDDAIYALGALPYLIEPTHLDVATGQSLFTFPTTMISMLQCWYDNRTLDRMTHAELLALSPHWEDERGSPVAYTDEHLSLRTFRLYPLPDHPSQPPSPPTANPFGPFAPLDHVTLITTAYEQDVPVWLELPLCFLLLSREYARESPHRDPLFAQGCQHLAQMLMEMLTLPGLG